MDCRKTLCFFFVSAIVAVNFSNVVVGFDLAGLIGSDSSCIQKLIPCKEYINSTSPPDTCCDPLKEMISTDAQCLCKVFDNADSLNSLGITQQGALGLAKICGASPDVSVCKTGSTNGTISASTGTDTTSSSTPVSVTASPPSNSRASAMSSGNGMISSVSIALSVAFFAGFYPH